MKLFILHLLTFITLISFGQKPTDTIYPRKDNGFNIDFLDSLIEIKINKVRNEYNLSSLKIDKTLRKNSKKNSVDCSNLDGFVIKHLFNDGPNDGIEVVCMSSLYVNQEKTTYEKVSNVIITLLMDSPPHKEIILLNDTKVIGSGSVILTKTETIILKNKPKKVTVTHFWTSIRFN